VVLWEFSPFDRLQGWNQSQLYQLDIYTSLRNFEGSLSRKPENKVSMLPKKVTFYIGEDRYFCFSSLNLTIVMVRLNVMILQVFFILYRSGTVYQFSFILLRPGLICQFFILYSSGSLFQLFFILYRPGSIFQFLFIWYRSGWKFQFFFILYRSGSMRTWGKKNPDIQYTAGAPLFIHSCMNSVLWRRSTTQAASGFNDG
jgi:hypothetical protein